MELTPELMAFLNAFEKARVITMNKEKRMEAEIKKCKGCRFYSGDLKGIGVESRALGYDGRCRKNSPSVTGFPAVKGEIDWCWEGLE